MTKTSVKGKARRALVLSVKLAPGVDARRSEEVFAGTPGIRSAVQLFPDEEEEEMRSFYSVEVDPSEAEQALERLRGDPAVEYAVESAPRKLVW